MQLFIMGLIVVQILAWKPKAGYVICVLLTLASFIFTSYQIIVHQVTATILTKNPIPIKVNEYMTYVHMATVTYIPSKFILLLLI